METLKLLGHEILIEDDLIAFNNTRTQFQTNIIYAEKKFRETYETHIKSLDDLVEKVPGISSAIIESIVEYAIGELVKLGIMDCDKEKFIDKYFGLNIDYSEYFFPIAEKYIEIEYSKEQIEEYRNLQKLGKSQWQGGAITAKTVGDSFKNAGDRENINKLKNEIFTDENTLEILGGGIYSCGFDIFYCFIDEIEEHTGEKLGNFDKDKADTIFINIKDHITDKDQAVKHILECISNYPYNVYYYTYLIDNNITDTEDIINIASYFGYNQEILGYELDSKRLRMKAFLEMDENNKQEVEEKIFEIKTNSQILNVDYSKEIKRLDSKFGFLIQKDIIPETKLKIEELISLEKFYVLNDLIKKGNPYAQQSLYYYYFNEENLTPKDLFNKFKDEDKTDNAFNIYILSQCYYRGYGTEEDTKKTLELLNKAMELRSLFAKFSLGYYYMEGYCNLDIDYELGGKLIEECAEKGLPAAQACLGSFYRTGKKGYNKDLNKAEELLTLAADYDHPYGIKELNNLYNSISVDSNPSSDSSLNDSDSGCYITTATCESFGKADDCYELNMFREFRDNYLIYSEGGKRIIMEYYETAPSIVKKISILNDKSDIYKKLWQEYLKPCVNLIETNMLNECKELYIKMVNELSERYMV